ncbi:unnamed protein product, partial [Mesorhabditis spiculigera]
MFFRRSLQTSAALRSDLVREAFVNKIKEFGKIGAELSTKDPAVKKSLQDELNRVAQKYQLDNAAAAKLSPAIESSQVESSIAAAYEGVTIKQLLEQVKKEETDFLARQAARRAEEAKRSGALSGKQ